MRSPEFVSLETVLYLHEEGLSRFGGAAGIRDLDMIESALGAAQNAFYYGEADLYGIAAAYAYHLAQAQAFFDGNKHVAVARRWFFLLRMVSIKSLIPIAFTTR